MEWLLWKECNIESVGKDVGCGSLSGFLVGMSVSVFALEKTMEVKNTQIAKIALYDSAIPFHSIYPKDLNQHASTDACNLTFIAVFFITVIIQEPSSYPDQGVE